MKKLKSLTICSLLFILSACESSNTTTIKDPSTLQETKQVRPNPVPATEVKIGKSKLLTKSQVEKVKLELINIYLGYTLVLKTYKERLEIVGPILQKGLYGIYEIKWESISEEDLNTLMDYFFDEQLNLKS